MAIEFSDSANSDGIVEQTRILARVDSNQWPTQRIVNSANNWKHFVAGYAIGADKRLRWDDTNHTKLPEGTMDLVAGQSDYSYLTDEQGNNILTLLSVSLVDSNGKETLLRPVDRSDSDFDDATYGTGSGTPSSYDKITDNIIRLNNKPSATDVSTYDLKLRFQRAPKLYTAADTTATTGFSPLLDRGFVIACAYDAALTLGLQNIQALALERQREEQKVVEYFANRNEDEEAVLRPVPALDDQLPNVYF